jgi:hypothetical protein
VTLTTSGVTSSYLCKLAHTNQTPPNGTYWTLIANGGAAGTNGTNGTNGSTNKQISFNISNAGSVIANGYTSPQFLYGFAATIVEVLVSGDDGAGGNGSCSIDIWKLAYHATNLPTISDSIVASAPVTITNAKNNFDATLTGWTTSISARDQFIIHVNTVTGFKNITVTLKLS